MGQSHCNYGADHPPHHTTTHNLHLRAPTSPVSQHLQAYKPKENVCEDLEWMEEEKHCIGPASSAIGVWCGQATHTSI